MPVRCTSVFRTLPNYSRCLPGDHSTGWHIPGDNRPCTDNRVITYRYAFQHKRPAPDPYVVADPHWPCDGRRIPDPMLIGVHDHYIPRDFAVPAYGNFLLSNDLYVAIEIRPVAYFDKSAAPAFQSYAGKEGTVRHLNTTSLVKDLDKWQARFAYQQAGAREPEAQPKPQDVTEQ